MSKDFNPYHKWLGIPEKKCPPTFYELLGISLDEEHEEVIKTAAQRQKSHVQQFMASDHAKLVKQLVYQIDEAEFTLLSPELRREYDRREKLFKKRRKNRQVDPIAVSSHVPFAGGPTIGEETGFVREYAGIMTVLVVAFMAMAGFSFWLPWEKLEKSEDIAPAVPEVKHEAKQSEINIPEVVVEPDVVPQPQGDPNFPKPVLSVTFDETPNSGIRLDNRGATFVAGKIGKAMMCDGKSFAIVPVSNLPSGKSPRTIAVWLKSTGVSSKYNRHAISYGNHSPPSSMPFGILQLNKLWGLYGWGSQADIEAEVDNEWHHHCLSYDGKTLTYRFDGRRLFKTTGTLTLAASAGPLVLGTYASLGNNYGFVGLIDEVLVYDTALSSEQVRMLIESQDADFIVADDGNMATADVLISEIDVAGRAMTVTRNSKTIVFDVSRKVVVLVDGKAASLGTLKAGQKVSITFDPEFNVVVSIEASVTEGGNSTPQTSTDPAKSSTTAKTTSTRTKPLSLDSLRRMAKSVKVNRSGAPIAVDLSDVSLTEEQLSQIATLSTLRRLTLPKTKLTDEGLQKLTPITNLTGLGMWQTRITSDGLRHVGRFTNLSYLSVEGNRRITDDGLKHLSKLRKLSWIGLSYTGVTDGGMQHLAKLPSLSRLELANTKLTDRGLNELMRIKSLKILNVTGTMVSQAGVAKLKRAIPNCKVIR